MPFIKEKYRRRPWFVVLVIVLTIAASYVWLSFLAPSINARGTTLARDAESAQTRTERQCPPDDRCQVSKEKWVSPRKMVKRFNSGRLGNAKNKRLPLGIRKAATRAWDRVHKVDPAKGGNWDCGDHWWCGPLKVESCAMQFFKCAGEHLGWENTRTLVLRCGGQAIIAGAGGTLTGSPVGTIVAAGIGGDACLYDQIGTYYGWW